MLTLNLSINKFFISLPSSFQRSLKKIRCLQNLLGTEWKIPYLMCYLPVWVRDNWKDLTNRNNSMEGSVQNIKKKSPDEVQLTEDTATLLKLQSEVASNCAVTTLYLNHLGSFDAENQHSWIPSACTDSEQDKLCTRKEMANLRVSQWGSPLFVTWLALKKSGFICTQGFEHHVWNYHPQQQFVQTTVRCLLFPSNPFAYSIQLFLSEDQPPDW